MNLDGFLKGITFLKSDSFFDLGFVIDPSRFLKDDFSERIDSVFHDLEFLDYV